MTFRILTVCSGNICRSPLAEQLLRAGLAQIPGVEVSSAGTIAMVDSGMPAQAAALSARFGATDASAHRARQLDEQLIRGADLVLGLAREHRRAIVEHVPAATRKAFTLREFAHLAAAVTDEDLDDALSLLPLVDPVETMPVETESAAVDARLRAAVIAAASLRGVVAPLDNPDDADVIDPYRQSDAVYETSASQLVPAVQATVDLFVRAAQRG
ncbi:low molecular weight phosphatase family protein [Agromyces italicus]|uniref:arsenate reductase/protein-tyrosine-phosphatase family protein n=1 Tax=Agromyces italicus TaxID=279572 RepID=UPI0003B68AC0|nr:low molecular weight phosphatase family protein [Agromyces italicus]